MQVGQKDVSDLVFMEAKFLKRRIQAVVSKWKIVAEEFFTLLVTRTVVDKDQPIPVFDKHAPQTHVDEIVGVGRIRFLPDYLGHDTKHGSAVQFEVSGIERVNLHSQFSRNANMQKMEEKFVKENKKTSRTGTAEIEVL
jgi:hypothetical protein